MYYMYITCIRILYILQSIAFILTTANSCINIKNVNQVTEIGNYKQTSAGTGDGTLTYDGKLETFMQTGAFDLPDQYEGNYLHWVMLYCKTFSIIKSVNVYSENIANFYKVFLLSDEPKYRNSDQKSAKLADETWKTLIPCELAVTNNTHRNTVCNNMTFIPSKHILVVFNSTDYGDAYERMQINEVTYSDIDINTPVSHLPTLLTNNWIVTCSGNITVPTCTDYLICHNNSSIGCWDKSSIEFTDVGTADPRGPYYCRLKQLNNQTDYFTVPQHTVSWFPTSESSNFTLSKSNITAGADTVEYTFSCSSSESLPSSEHNITISSSVKKNLNFCHNETSQIHQEEGKYGGKIIKTEKTVKLCSQLNITITATCLVTQNGFQTENITTDSINYVFLNGQWSEWSIGTCEAENNCGVGIMTRNRTCNNPPPTGTGKNCEGNKTITETCDTNKTCPESTTQELTTTEIPTTTEDISTTTENPTTLLITTPDSTAGTSDSQTISTESTVTSSSTQTDNNTRTSHPENTDSSPSISSDSSTQTTLKPPTTTTSPSTLSQPSETTEIPKRTTFTDRTNTSNTALTDTTHSPTVDLTTFSYTSHMISSTIPPITTKPSPSPDTPNAALIVGIVFGSLSAVAIAVVITILLCKHFQKPKTINNQNQRYRINDNGGYGQSHAYDNETFNSNNFTKMQNINLNQNTSHTTTNPTTTSTSGPISQL